MKITGTPSTWPNNGVRQPRTPQPQSPSAAQFTVPDQPAAAQKAQTNGPSPVSEPDFFSISSLAGILSAQGRSIANPYNTLALHISPSSGNEATSTDSASASGDIQAGSLLTASEIASRIVNSLGNNGKLSLAEVEKIFDAQNPGKLTNSDADIETDFRKLTGGGNELTAAQLTEALQRYMNTQNQRGPSSSTILT